MRLVITEKQLQQLIRLRTENQELTEQGEGEGAPEAGTSSDGDQKTGASKWESGVTRGPANQIGVTKWSEVVGSKISRGKANPLSEQGSIDFRMDRRYGTYDAAVKSAKEDRELVQGVIDFYKKYNHEINTVLGIGAAFIPFVGPAITAGIGMIDAKQYYDEGDTKMAGMVGMFSLLPGVGTVISKIPGVKTLGAKGMTELAKKLTLGSKITNPTEIEVVSQMAKYKDLIKAEMEKIGKNATITAARKGVQQNIVKKNITNKAAGIGGNVLGYGGLGVAYSMGYDKLTGGSKPDKQTVARLTTSKAKPVTYKQEDMELVDGVWVPK